MEIHDIEKMVYAYIEINPQGYIFQIAEGLIGKLGYSIEFEDLERKIIDVVEKNTKIQYLNTTKYYNAIKILNPKLSFHGYASVISGRVQNPFEESIDFTLLNKKITKFSYFKNNDIDVIIGKLLSGTFDIFDLKCSLSINNYQFMVRANLITQIDHPIYHFLLKEKNLFSQQSGILTALNCGSYFVFSFIYKIIKNNYKNIELVIERISKEIP